MEEDFGSAHFLATAGFSTKKLSKSPRRKLTGKQAAENFSKSV